MFIIPSIFNRIYNATGWNAVPSLSRPDTQNYEPWILSTWSLSFFYQQPFKLKTRTRSESLLNFGCLSVFCVRMDDNPQSLCLKQHDRSFKQCVHGITWEAWIHSTDIQILNHLIISALWLGLQASSVVLKVPHWTDHLRSFNAYFYCKKIFFFKNSSMLFLLLLFLMCTFCIGF